MTPGDLGPLILAFVAGLLALNAVAHWLFGPDPDLEPDPEEVIRFAPCGDKDCVNPHPYRKWVGRQR